MWMGGIVVIRRAVWLATTKDIGENFVVADSVSSLGDDWNRGGEFGSS